MIEGPVQLGFLAAAGLALGSFAVTSGLRLAEPPATVLGRSRCDGCGVSLGFLQTVPVVSFACLRGACQRCGGRIHPIHLVGEVAGAAVLLGAAVLGDPLRAALVGVIGLLLIGAAATDWKALRLPDGFTFAVGAAGLALSAARSLEALAAGVVAAGCVVALLQAVRWLSQRRRGEPGLGFGDVKLAAALALWLGVATPWLLVVASILGLAFVVIARPAGRFAFGPWLAAAAWLVGLSVELQPWPMTA